MLRVCGLLMGVLGVLAVTASGIDMDMGAPSRHLRHLASCPSHYTAAYIGVYANAARDAAYVFHPTDIDTDSVTHLILAFVQFNAVGDVVIPDADLDQMKDIVRHVRDRNPCIKVSVTVGGWDFGSEVWTVMVADPFARRAFITNMVSFLRLHDFDGVDLDWEFPGFTSNGGRAQDKANFLSLVRELRTEIESESLTSFKSKLLLTLAIGAHPSIVEAAYDTVNLPKEVDYMHILAYHYTYHGDPRTGFQSPLTTLDGLGVGIQETFDVWYRVDAPREKLILAVPAFAEAWTTAVPTSATRCAVGSPAVGPGLEGPITHREGLISYLEITKFCLRDGSNVATCVPEWAAPGSIFVDQHTLQAYACFGDQFYSFDTPETLKAKISHMMAQGVGGAALWSLDQDQFDTPGVAPLLAQVDASVRTGSKSSDSGPDQMLLWIIAIGIFLVCCVLPFIVHKCREKEKDEEGNVVRKRSCEETLCCCIASGPPSPGLERSKSLSKSRSGRALNKSLSRAKLIQVVPSPKHETPDRSAAPKSFDAASPATRLAAVVASTAGPSECTSVTKPVTSPNGSKKPRKRPPGHKRTTKPAPAAPVSVPSPSTHKQS